MLTPLHIAAVSNAPECATLLLEAKADLESTDKNDWTPLFHAMCLQNVAVATLLQNKGNPHFPPTLI